MKAPLDILPDMMTMQRRLQTAENTSVPGVLTQAVALRLGANAFLPSLQSRSQDELACQADPLLLALALVASAAGADSISSASPPVQGPVRQGEWALRLEIARVLTAIASAERHRRQALRRLAPLRETAASGNATSLVAWLLYPIAQSDTSRSLGQDMWMSAAELVDFTELQAGLTDLAHAVQALDQWMATTREVPVVVWRWQTPLGWVIVDTTESGSNRRLRDVLLLVDAGGSDIYEFEERGAHNRISVLLDRQGDDRYVALADAADPSAAVLGLGLLWDSGGNDEYTGRRLAQGAALFGAALLYDAGGEDQYRAEGFAQGFALAGTAVLLEAGGSDSYLAQTHAQASAGPLGVALVLDESGDDSYHLANSVLVLPSSQLRDRNVSMGQGAARGQVNEHTRQVLSGGIAALVDLAGSDRYVAQVFAQGAGYLGGIGLLVDARGSDTFEGAWYVMGASAHEAIGVMLAQGPERDMFQVSHSTSLAAAHDGSIALFRGEGVGNYYRLGNLGLGASNDEGLALFIGAAGGVYEVDAHPCLAFGAVRRDPNLRVPASRSGMAIFYPSNEAGPVCTRRNHEQ